jgi:hypothetical protein
MLALAQACSLRPGTSARLPVLHWNNRSAWAHGRVIMVSDPRSGSHGGRSPVGRGHRRRLALFRTCSRACSDAVRRFFPFRRRALFHRFATRRLASFCAIARARSDTVRRSLSRSRVAAFVGCAVHTDHGRRLALFCVVGCALADILERRNVLCLERYPDGHTANGLNWLCFAPHARSDAVGRLFPFLHRALIHRFGARRLALFCTIARARSDAVRPFFIPSR